MQTAAGLTVTPIGYADGYNLYAYVSGRVLGSLDPLGLKRYGIAPSPPCPNGICYVGEEPDFFADLVEMECLNTYRRGLEKCLETPKRYRLPSKYQNDDEGWKKMCKKRHLGLYEICEGKNKFPEPEGPCWSAGPPGRPPSRRPKTPCKKLWEALGHTDSNECARRIFGDANSPHTECLIVAGIVGCYFPPLGIGLGIGAAVQYAIAHDMCERCY